MNINALYAINDPPSLYININTLYAINDPPLLYMNINTLYALNDPPSLYVNINTLYAINDPPSLYVNINTLYALNYPPSLYMNINTLYALNENFANDPQENAFPSLCMKTCFLELECVILRICLAYVQKGKELIGFRYNFDLYMLFTSDLNQFYSPTYKVVK